MPTNVSSSSVAAGLTLRTQKYRAVGLTLLMIFSSLAALQFASWEAAASTDQDGDGLTLGLEFLLNTQPTDWDSDNDGLPDGWEYQYGLDPLDASSLGNDGAAGDPDGDGLTNLQEYTYLEPSSWDLSSTPSLLDNGVWWNGTVPVRNWDEESAMQATQGQGSDGADEDPMGDMCNDNIDNDYDGLVDSQDSDNDGDAVCGSDDDDGDGDIDEDPDGWDTDNDGMSDGWEVANGLNATSPFNDDGMFGDPDGDGLVNIYEYMNPSWDTSNNGVDYFQPGPAGSGRTETISPCNPVLAIGPGGCTTLTAEVDGVFTTNPLQADSDGDGLNDSYEALVLLTDPTDSDTDSDGIDDGVEVNGLYGNPPQASDPRDNNTDDDLLDDGDEDKNGNGQIDANETDPTRREDAGDFDNDGIENWEENLTCTLWNVYDSDFGGIGDGDERNWSHGTNPCDSFIDFSSLINSYDASLQRLSLANTTGFNPIGGIGYYNDSNGQHTSFAYSAIQSNILLGVSLAPPVGTTDAVSKNGSWCHYDAVNTGTIGSTQRHCDDDYEDSDGDGLADWQELEGTFGFTSLPTAVDSDGDGVSDYEEVMDGTDPMEPCHNNRDSDGDLLNDYFENNTGCALIFIPGIIGNGSLDTYTTNYLAPDTDAGGVWDGQEYIDGTNPQNNPNDDQNPVDTDGDGIPDSVENLTGTDWRDPDTDGGGMIDGEECPPPLWALLCINGAFDPLDPSDDIVQNEIVFYANNSTVGVDSNLDRFWRVHTFDSYTGAAYGKNTSAQIWNPMPQGFTNEQWIANNSFHNSTESWSIEYVNSILNANLPHPYATTGVLNWADTLANLSHGNITHDIKSEDGEVFTMFIDAPEIWYDTSELDLSIPYAGAGTYAMDLPSEFTDPTHPFSEVLNITDDVIAAAGAVSAYDKAVALQQFLLNGNATIEYLRNYDGSQVAEGEDLTYHLVVGAREGRCTEFATAFTTMLRLAGLPARKVSGFHGGFWNGEGYTVAGIHSDHWAEVHLQTSPAGNSLDMGWIPLDPCPAATPTQIVNETWEPLTVHRNHSTLDIWLNGTLEFENNTAIENHTVRLYLMPPADANQNPSLGATGPRLLGAGTTGSLGNFTLRGIPAEIVEPGYGSLVVEVVQGGYVELSYKTFPWTINVTDTLNITQDTPSLPGEPIVGAGTTTLVSGNVRWENVPYIDPSEAGSLILFMNYTSTVDGAVSLQTTVGEDGYYEFNVTLDENEAIGLLPAVIEFPGWHVDDLHLVSPPTYHGLPSSYNLNFNISAAPNLTATLEGPGSNNSLLSIDENLYINGTILSRGQSVVPMEGTLWLQMRMNGSSGPMENVTSWVLNASTWSSTPGNFSIVWNFTVAQAQELDPGHLDVELLFIPDALGASDTAGLQEAAAPANLSYGLQTILSIEYDIGPLQRGQDATSSISLTDHRGNYVLTANGTYISIFDGTTIATNNSVDAESGMLNIEWIPDPNIAVGDYVWYTNYTSTTQWYKNATSQGDVRITGLIVVGTTLSSDWVHIGSTTYITGDIQDDLTNNPVTGNQTTLIFEFEIPGEGPPDPMGNPPPPTLIPIGSVAVNSTTGQFNFSFTMPTNMPGGIWDISVAADFSAGAPPGGAYYNLEEPHTFEIGSESESTLLINNSNVLVEVSNDLVLEVDVKDIAAFFSEPPIGLEDMQNISQAGVEFFWDASGTNTSLGVVASDSDGRATLTWAVPLQQEPGFYDVWIVMYDDQTDTLSTNNGARYTGNDTMANVTVQVTSSVIFDPSVPASVVAGTNFQLSGAVQDSVNSSRPFSGPVRIDVFWLDEPEELLASGFTTAVNGTFNLSVNSDPELDGIVSGNHTLVVSVIEGSSPFYLTATGTQDILVMGVTDFEQTYPLSGIVVNRGDSVVFGGKLVETTNFGCDTCNGAPLVLNSTTVSAQFHDTWLSETTTDVNGSVEFTYNIPPTQPLGPITITLNYNGTWNLLPDASPINTVTVRSITVLVVDTITDNPIAGGGFNVSGTLVSDNGSAIILRDGTPMLPTLTFDIDGFTDTFTSANGTAQANGTWWAWVTLDAAFPRGTHTITAEYTPTVNFYEFSSGNNTFDSRGYSVLTITSPADLDLEDRTIRGENFTLNISLVDNAGDPVVGETVSIDPVGMNVPLNVTTDANGFGTVTITVLNTTTPGPHTILAEYLGLSGTTGVIGDSTSTRIVILAPTVLAIDSIEGELIAGQTLIVNGTLLDEWGLPLLDTDGNASGGVIHLAIDGVGVGNTWSTISNGTTGEFSLVYTLPQNIEAGGHVLEVSFLGGYLWVDPVGAGDSVNPEYYLGSTATGEFNATQPTHIDIILGGGEIDREELISMSGILLDSVNRPVANMSISIYLDNVFLTNVTTTGNGTFDVFYPVPSDMTLGPVTMDVEYLGASFYLPSSSSVDWQVFSAVNVDISPPEAAAIGDTVTITGTVRDNLPAGWVSGHNVDIRIDGMLIGNATTDGDGVWALNWTIPSNMELGSHNIEVFAPEQGWYRSGVANETLWVAHHSAISLSSNGGDATRGFDWVITGRLYDSDVVGLPGIANAEVQVALDGASIATLVTDENGNFSVLVPVDMSSTRGDHIITALYVGDSSWLGSENQVTVTTWADVDVQITFVSDNSIRGDQTHPVRIEGRIDEVGGSGNTLTNLSLVLMSGNTTLPTSNLIWDNQTGGFVIEFTADRFLSPGYMTLVLTSEEDNVRYLNPANTSAELFLRVRATFEINPETITVGWGSHTINGTVTVRDYFSSQAIPGIAIEAHLQNQSEIDPFEMFLAGFTDDNGVWEFEFSVPESLPPLSDQDHWGTLYLQFNSSSVELSEDSRDNLARDLYVLEYESQSQQADSVSYWVYGLVVAIIVAAGAGAWVLYARRREAVDELAEIFSYTAELLAAGDAIRESILHCYEELCGVLMAHGHLRRDFETVREFEMAIRKAMPTISDESLTALDNMFEVARYSRQELGDSHRNQATMALQRAIAEIQNATQMPANAAPPA
ncbi:MAG: transglutaminase domain-containing protein [Candidatus Thermoplasmatota archaeon]|nr:transglutaminase domain-containing protein [Candidatus Thermoplasmatota archaeon]